tara:strand:+ start:11454 stop:12710 length:1257 start_codon:yes stop_codon:yes gene_type:complete
MIPYISSKALLGFTKEFQSDPFNLIDNCFKEFGNIFQFRLGIYKPIIVLDSKIINYILQNHFNYPKSILYEDMKTIMGEGLITSKDEHWKIQRKKIQPIFHNNLLKEYSDKINSISEKAVDSIIDKKQINLENWLTEISLNIILEVILGLESLNNKKLINDINIIIKFFKKRSESILKIPISIPTDENRKFKLAYKRFLNELNQLIDKKVESHSSDVLYQLIVAHHNDENYSQLLDEIITLILAGHETIAHSLFWTICHLSDNSKIEKYLIKSLETKTNSNLRNIINESLRLSPPVPILTRNTLESETIYGKKFKSGSLIIIPIFNFHRLSKHWKNPSLFNPDRWTNPTKNINNIFIPFASGPRKCIGNRLSYLELETIITKIYSNLKFKRESANEIKYNPFITLRPDQKIIMNIQPI